MNEWMEKKTKVRSKRGKKSVREETKTMKHLMLLVYLRHPLFFGVLVLKTLFTDKLYVYKLHTFFVSGLWYGIKWRLVHVLCVNDLKWWNNILIHVNGILIWRFALNSFIDVDVVDEDVLVHRTTSEKCVRKNYTSKYLSI